MMVRTTRRRALAAAVVSAVVLGVGASALPALADDVGSISGHLTDAGAPVGASVTLYDTDFGFVDFTFTDGDGAFTFADVPAGDYKIEFNAAGLVQWASQKLSFDDADVITVTAGGTTVVEEVLLPTGSIAGHVTRADGTPAAFISVSADQDGPPFASGFTTTDGNGDYTLQRLLPGVYRVAFRTGFTQYANTKLSFDEADLIPVTVGETTSLDQQLLPTGSISGQVTNSDGTPAASVSVSANQAGPGSGSGFASTDENGRYTLSDLLPGEYRVEFSRGSQTQYANNKLSFDEADLIPVTVGETTSLDQQLLPTGTIAGRVTNADGTPAAFLEVSAEGDPGGVASTQTDEDGHYTLSDLIPGQYRVRFQRDFDTPGQYANNKVTFHEADLIPVTADETTVLDQQLLPTGRLTGVLRSAAGDPVPFTRVTATLVTAPEQVTFDASTDEQGIYTIDAFAGDYWLTFNAGFGTQWATGRSSPALADPVTIVAGATTTHDETLAPTGTVSFTAVDGTTHQPLPDFCVFVGSFDGCTDTGSLTVDLPPGRYDAFHFVTSTQYVTGSVVVTVPSGATAPVVLEFTRAATVTTTVVDRKSGAPVANICLELVNVKTPQTLGNSESRCSDATGAVTVDFVRPGRYKAFAWAHDDVHGHQWVGFGGGVGEFDEARTITVTAGKSLTLPKIKVDKAGGAVTGTLTDEVTGAPVTTGGFVSLSSFNSGTGPGSGAYELDRDGRYTISGLGPYPWTLLFHAGGYAAEWSGNAAIRSKASTVTVHETDTVTYNVAVGAGTTIMGTVTDAHGTAAHLARITIHSVDSRDEIGTGDIFELNPDQYRARVKGPQKVKVSYIARVGLQDYRGFVGGTRFENATTFTVPAGGTLTINITVTQTDP